jgi:hypothetical protein
VGMTWCKVLRVCSRFGCLHGAVSYRILTFSRGFLTMPLKSRRAYPLRFSGNVIDVGMGASMKPEAA